MTRILFIFLLFANLLFFSYIRWGNLLTQDNASAQLQPPLNSDEIKIIPPSPDKVLSPTSGKDSSLPEPHTSPATEPKPVSPDHQGSAVSPVTADSCVVWGEFSGSDLANATSDLASLNLGANLSHHEVEHSLGYWVYIPPAKSQATINARISQLKKLKIKDYFVVHEQGKWHNAISLGVFKAEDVANKYLEHLKHIGLKTAATGKRQSRLKFIVFKLKNPGAETLAKMTNWQKDFTGIEIKPTPCK
jgi:SPOR domain